MAEVVVIEGPIVEVVVVAIMKVDAEAEAEDTRLTTTTPAITAAAPIDMSQVVIGQMILIKNRIDQ